LIIHPDKDRVVPIEEARILAALIPGAQLLPIATQNHMPLAEEPAWSRFIEHLGDFVPRAPEHGPAIGSLSGREKEILEYVAQGAENREIAKILGLSEKTVRNHVSTIFDKLDVSSRARAIVLAREAGLGTRKG
jgi:DNA-binding NarL/FixJ family response regulator